ncbi:MAG: MarR family transcriptional regulator [Mesorhizobium sp.]|nr:MAG: MarR family transcriptional regulator [Mesorhizobium sp.]
MLDDQQTLLLDDFIPYLLSVLASRLSVGLASVYEQRFGISIAEWRVLAHLSSNQAVSTREITAQAHMDKSKVSRAVARLEEAGLVAKRVNIADRRLVELSMTRKGQRLFEQIVPLALDYQRRVLSNLTPDEGEFLREIIGRLLSKLPSTSVDEN